MARDQPPSRGALPHLRRARYGGDAAPGYAPGTVLLARLVSRQPLHSIRQLPAPRPLMRMDWHYIEKRPSVGVVPSLPWRSGRCGQTALKTQPQGPTLWGNLQIDSALLAWDTVAVMDRQELRTIVGFLSGLQRGLDSGDDQIVDRTTLTELSGVIDRLMNAAFDAAPLKKRVRLARLERKARRQKRQIEARLDTRD